MPHLTRWAGCCCFGLLYFAFSLCSPAQESSAAPDAQMRARRFLAGRTPTAYAVAAGAILAARQAHLAMMQSQPADTHSVEARSAVASRLTPLSTPWQPVGPAQIASQRYGTISGRVTAIALDPADTTGNTVYVGTTGGGVWKSTNAAGPAASVAFVPLTDTLPVFSANAGGVAIPSLSIGAVSVSPTGNGRVVLAGTGDPNDATDSYYGEGFLRSADGGITWTLIQQSTDGLQGNHSFIGLGTAGFAWSTATPNLVVAAMTQAVEGVIVNSPIKPYSVKGLYFSTDAGVTWQMATIEDGSQIVQRPLPGGYPGNAATAVAWNPQRQRFYAAVQFHGYYESIDGQIWTRLANQPGPSLTLTACPTHPGSTGSPTCPIFRGALAVELTTGDTFALTVDANNLDQGLWQDVCGLSTGNCATAPITFAARLPSAPLEVGSGNTAIAQADYNLSLAAIATGSGAAADTLLFAGTTDLYRCSLAAGCVLRNTTNATNGCAAPAMVSPAQHAIATPTTNPTLLLFLGNDGGLWRSTDGVNQQQTPCSSDDATHFQNLNAGLGSLAEVVSFAQHPTDPATVLVGLGANGTAATGTATTTAPWPQISTGEGGTVAIDPTNPQNWYVSTAAGVSLRYCGNGSACGATDFTGAPTIGYVQVKQDASVIDPPFLLDPALTSNVIIGTCRVWRGAAQSGASWPGLNAMGPNFAGPQNATCSGSTNALVRSLAASGPASGAVATQNAGSTVLYAGMAGTIDGGGIVPGHIFSNYAAGAATATTVWNDLANSMVTNDGAGVFNPGGFDISSVVADAHDSTGKTVYATVMGFAGNGINAAHVYRSTDGGATWINISSNLPNAPANAIAVDPNDANTLYVALDTGIYVTTSATTCATANCWSVFGTGLPNAPVVALSVGAGMATGDGRLGELRAATYGRGIWQIPMLNATPPAAPAITLTPHGLTFAAQQVATLSPAQTTTVTNSGSTILFVTQIVTTGDFNESNTCSPPAGIAVGAICTIQVGFLPSATGARPGLLTVYGNVAGGQATASLNGTGVDAAAILLSPVAVTFPSTNIGSTSSAQNITISNTGGSTATLQPPIVTGDFNIYANTCGTTLGPNVGCTVAIVFVPTVSGPRTGTLTIDDSAGTQTSSLAGLGLQPSTDALTPSSLTFAPQQLNTASATQAVTLTNTGDAALTLIAAQITSGDFTVINSCGNSLNGHASCSLLAAFVPRAVGPNSGTLTVTDQYRTQNIPLNGIGVAPAGVSLSPTGSMSFAPTGVGAIAAFQAMTLTNNGGLPLQIQSIAVSSDFLIVPGSNTCGTILVAGSVCTAQIAFAPSVAGFRSGSVTIIDNAAGSPQTLQLTGTGIDFTLTANGSTSATIAAGSQAVFPLLLASIAGLPGTVTFTCGPLPPHATCTVNPATPLLGGTSTIAVTVATSVVGALLHRPSSPSQTTWFTTLLPLGMLTVRKRRPRAFAALVCILLLAGCGASRVIPLSSTTSPINSGPPTAPGAYNIIVTGTSAGIAHRVSLTLTVQ